MTTETITLDEMVWGVPPVLTKCPIHHGPVSGPDSRCPRVELADALAHVHPSILRVEVPSRELEDCACTVCVLDREQGWECAPTVAEVAWRARDPYARTGYVARWETSPQCSGSLAAAVRFWADRGSWVEVHLPVAEVSS